MFAINNLARKAYNDAEPANITVLKKNESVTFRHMLLIKNGGAITNEELAAEMEKFVNK